MNRRRSARYARRLQVRFWRPGEDRARAGFSTNISTTGMHIGTNSPLPAGSRLRIEVVDRDHGFVVEGLVMHAKKMPVELQQVTPSGMGVRFLSVADLLRELLPAAAVAGDDPPAAERPAPPPPAATSVTTGTSTAKARSAVPPVESAGRADRPAPPRPQPATDREPADGRTGAGVVTVTFASPHDFLEVYRRDLVHGGLFISTRYPGKLNETLEVELCPPLSGSPPVRLRARVVHRVEPRSDDMGPNLLAGMGVEILDLPALLARLAPVAARLQ